MSLSLELLGVSSNSKGWVFFFCKKKEVYFFNLFFFFCQHVMPWVYFVRVLSQFFQVGLKTLRIMYAIGVGIQTSVLTKH